MHDIGDCYGGTNKQALKSLGYWNIQHVSRCEGNGTRFFFPTVFGRVDFLIKTAKSGNYYNNTIVLLVACYKQKSSLPD